MNILCDDARAVPVGRMNSHRLWRDPHSLDERVSLEHSEDLLDITYQKVALPAALLHQASDLHDSLRGQRHRERL